ncbi:RNA polymerase sigma factor [Planctomycetota bacterium]
MEDRSVEVLVRASWSGDREAFARLMERYYRSIYLTCLSQLVNIHDAEDVAQDTFMQALAKLKQLKDPTRFAPWLDRIARNLCMEVLRGRQRMRVFQSKWQAQSETETDHEELLHVVRQLPMELRRPLVLYFLKGQKVEQVAQCLNISASGVYQRLHQATRHLFKMLIQEQNR